MKSRSKTRAPNPVNLTVKRRYLTEREVERLMDCARKHGRYGQRDATMILVAYRHSLRASEVCDLQWQQIELSEGRLHVHRVKNRIASASRPCCCQSSAKSNRKRLLNARRVGPPPTRHQVTRAVLVGARGSRQPLLQLPALRVSKTSPFD